MKGIKLARVFLFVLATTFIGCTKIDTTDLGNELIPAIDNVNTFLTVLDVTTDNKLFNDSTRMIDGQHHAVGIIENDPDFGKTVATSYVSFTPTAYRSYPFVKRDTVVIDSVVLSLNFSSVFGDSNSVQQFEVREIDNRFIKFKDSFYLLNASDFTVYDEVIGSSSIDFRNLNDSIMYRNVRDTIRRSNELRIHIDTSWARRFVNYDTTSTSAYNNDSVFKEQFAGLQIKTVDGQGTRNALAYFNLEDADRSRITFYCRIQNNGRTDTIAPYFSYTNDPQANIIRRTPANAYLANLSNSTENDELLYIQSAPGSYALIDFPGMDTVAAINRIIHRAELVFEKYPSQDQFYAAPPLMFIDALSTTGDSSFTIRNDFMPVSSGPGYDLSLLGGVYRNNQYVFNLTRYLQSIVTKKFTSYKLRVYAPFTTQPYYMPENSDRATDRTGIIVNTPVASGRVVLYGGASTDPKRAQLRIIYSKL